MLKGPVETKVKAAATASPFATLLVLVILHFVPWLNGDGELLADVIASALGAVATLIAGYLAKHTDRPDLAPLAPVQPIGPRPAS